MSNNEGNQLEIDEEKELSEHVKKAQRHKMEQPVPPVVARQNQLLYGTSEEVLDPLSPAPPGSFVEREAQTTNMIQTLGLTRLVRRLQEPPQELRIVVNDVGIRLPVIGWDLQPRALLCLVTGHVSCDLPLTSDVKIHLGEKVLTATFVGQWHKVDWLPFQVVAFALTETEG